MLNKLTIITSTLNASILFVDTAESIKSLKKQLPIGTLQWIVVDGMSNDDIFEYFKIYDDIIDNLIIEKDHGIYSAWNKGLDLANGNWVIFLGAGDTTNFDWITYILEQDFSYELIYANLEIQTKRKLLIQQSNSVSTFRKRITFDMVIPHPGLAHNLNLFRHKKFSEDFKIISDWIFIRESKINNILKNNVLIQATFNQDGVSSSYRGKSIIAKEKFYYNLNYCYKFDFRNLFRYLVFNLLPQRIYLKINSILHKSNHS